MTQCKSNSPTDLPPREVEYSHLNTIVFQAIEIKLSTILA